MTPNPNDDKTIIADSTAPSAAPPLAGAASGDNALPKGSRLGEFEIVDLVGVGGFGIVYLAHDHSLGRHVALKEYMPQALAARGAGVKVSVRSARHAETFEAGLRSFVNEARLLAQFDHPSLVKVYRFWEANGTAYMVMPFYEGRTLKDVLKARAAPPDEAWFRQLLAPLLDALEAIHAARVFHRDIAPDNIILLAGDRPLLLDFGAARHVISDMTQALTVILKPGYAPIEQYAEVPDLKQGAWTDLYALAAVVYFAITGKTPAPSVGRMMNDTMAPLAHQAAGQYSDAFLRAIDHALAVKPADRPQSVAAFRQLLGHGVHTGSGSPDEVSLPFGAPVTTARSMGIPRPSLSRMWVLGAAAIAVGGALVLFTQLRRDEPGEVPQMPVADTAPAKPEPAIALAAPARPFNPLDEVDRIFEQRDRGHNVSVTMAKSQVRIGRDKLSFNVRSSKAGYLYVLMVGTDRHHFYLLFPNQIDTDNRIAVGVQLELPRAGWSMSAEGPAGTNQFVAIVSDNRRDFRSAGLVPKDPFAEFELEAAARAAQAASGANSPFAGAAICPAGGSACSAMYGAAMFTIEEIDPEKQPAR